MKRARKSPAQVQPAAGEFFVVAHLPDEVFRRPEGGEVRDFGPPIGRCLQARRCAWDDPSTYPMYGADIRAEGEREWVQISAVTKTFRTGEDVITTHLFPEFFRIDTEAAREESLT